ALHEHRVATDDRLAEVRTPLLELQRLLTAGCEHLARVNRPRRGAHVEQQGPVHKPRLVRRRDHVLKRLDRENLRLVKDLDVDLVETATEATLASAEQDPRPVLERDLLLT